MQENSFFTQANIYFGSSQFSDEFIDEEMVDDEVVFTIWSQFMQTNIANQQHPGTGLFIHWYDLNE